MDSFSEQLRTLAHNRYFAYAAVIFFAFLTALVFAILALQSTIAPTANDIRDSVARTETPGGTSTGGTGTSAGGPTQPAAQSPLDRIISIITGRSASQQPSESTGGGAGSGTGGAGAQGKSAEDVRAEAMRKVLQASTQVPEIKIDKYVLVTNLPEKPTELQGYRLKTNYSDLDVTDLATKLGFQSIDAVEKYTTISQLYDIGQGHYLGFDRASGHFMYTSDTGFTPTRIGTTSQETAKNVLAQLGIDDSRIKPYATYRRTDNLDSVYVELHRDWVAMGAPILNPVGMLNLTDTERLDSLSFSSQPDSSHVDTRITSTSDDMNGYSRPDSFNTITVHLASDNSRVLGISSNIPTIVEAVPLSGGSIKSPIDAFNEYKNGQTSMALTGPAGEGRLDLGDVYSNGLAASPSVDVTDFELIYAAALSDTQEWWCPSYALRSFGKIQTGFDVQFSHTVPASTDPRCQTAVLGAATGRMFAQNTGPLVLPTPDASRVLPTTIVGGPDKNASSLQYGTLGFKVDAIIDTPVNECPPNFNHSYVLKQTPDYTDYVAWIDENVVPTRKLLGRVIKGQVKNFKPRSWYFVRKKKAGSQATLESLNTSYSQSQLISFRQQAIRKSEIGDPNLSPLDPKFNGLETITCQHIVTASPWIYIYSDVDTDFSVQLDPVGGVAYVKPAFTDVATYTWDVTAGQNTSPTLFWEYYKADVLEAYRSFTSSHPVEQRGYVVASSSLKEFMAGLSVKLGLNVQEQKNVLAELNRESMAFTSPFVRVSFAPQAFVESALPLSVSPAPDHMNRIYFEFTPLSSFEKISHPALPQIIRGGSTIVETGFIVTGPSK
jgi:hypothetical protein